MQPYLSGMKKTKRLLKAAEEEHARLEHNKRRRRAVGSLQSLYEESSPYRVFDENLEHLDQVKEAMMQYGWCDEDLNWIPMEKEEGV